MIIAIDVDDVCCDLQNHWIGMYNKKTNESLTKEDITSWDVNSFVKKGFDVAKEYFQDPNLWNEMPQIEGSLWGVKKLREKRFQIIFVTASNEYNFGAKFWWLKRNGYLESVEEYIECKRKYLIDADILIDDKFQNIDEFTKWNNIRKGILFRQPWNKKEDHPNYLTANNWEDVINIVSSGIAERSSKYIWDKMSGKV